MPELDLKKRLAHLYKPSAKVPSIIDVPPMRFLMLDGVGGVGGRDYQMAVQALYSLAYPVKFAAKKQLDVAYAVMPLEGLYWDPDGGEGSWERRLDSAWTLMILLPDEVPGELVDATRQIQVEKKQLPLIADVRVQTFSEGRSVQMLHLGPYADEQRTMATMNACAADKGLVPSGKHHEIYLSDPNKTAPEKLKTVLRTPVARQR